MIFVTLRNTWVFNKILKDDCLGLHLGKTWAPSVFKICSLWGRWLSITPKRDREIYRGRHLFWYHFLTKEEVCLQFMWFLGASRFFMSLVFNIYFRRITLTFSGGNFGLLYKGLNFCEELYSVGNFILIISGVHFVDCVIRSH
jgi:hypothetical protein